jgi:hypothetical protein
MLYPAELWALAAPRCAAVWRAQTACFLLYKAAAMANSLQISAASCPSDAQLIQCLRRTLDQSYSRMVTIAAREWDRRCRGKDPADACVRVRVSGRRLLGPR